MSSSARGSVSPPRTGGRNQGSNGSLATGRSANTGTQVTSLERQELQNEYSRQNMLLDIGKRELEQSAAYQERLDRNVYAPYQRRNLASEEKKTDRNAKSQEKVAATQAAASQYGSKQSAEASKYGSKQSTEAQKFAAAQGTKQAEIQARAQMFAANVDAAARQFETKTKGRTEFSGLLANLAAAAGNKSADNTAALLSTAGQVSAAASQSKNADADRMADMYKSIMQTYNTGSGQFRYW